MLGNLPANSVLDTSDREDDSPSCVKNRNHHSREPAMIGNDIRDYSDG